MKIKEYIQKVVDNGKQEDMEELSTMLEELLYKIKEYDRNCYDEYKLELYEMAYGKVLTEEMAHEIVHDMQPYGEYWDINTTTSVKNQLGINDITDVDFYVSMNKTYNDNKDTVERFADTDDKKLEMYVSLAKDFVNDIDAKEGKVFTYFMVIPKK